MPRRRLERPRNLLAWSAGISVALHATILALMIITFPNKTPPEPPPTNSVDVVFEPGNKTPTAPDRKGRPTPERQAAPRGKPSPTPQRTVQAAPPPAPLPQPAIKPPTPVPPAPTPPTPKPVQAPKPLPTPPLPKPPVPKPVPHPAAPKPPPPLPKVNLPPPPPPAPAAPKTPKPIPAPVPLPSELSDNTPAEVNLNLPPMPELAPMNLPPPPPMPPTPPAPQKAVPARRSGHGRSNAFSQGMVMNGMSFGGGGGPGGNTRGMNLNLPSSMQPRSGSEVSIKGDPGTNWMSKLEQWASARADYPEFAAEMRQQGAVTVNFTADRAGHVSKLTLTAPTRYALLNEAIMSLFRNAQLPPFDPDAKSDTIDVQFTIEFVLDQ